MNNFQQHLERLSKTQLIAYLTAIGAILATWIIYIQHGWVNDDFVLYHEAARLFTIGEIKSGWALFSWPLYSLLMAGVHKLTTLSLQNSANVLMISTFALSTYSLLRIASLAGGDKTIVILTALLLFSTTYITGDVLPMLLRDPPFWGFTLISIVYFIHFYRTHKLKDAILWQITSLIAMLFRIEGATYLAILPFTLLWLDNTPLKTKFKYLLKAHAINITLFILVSLIVVLHGDLSIQQLGRLQELFSSWSAIQNNFNQTIMAKVNTLATGVLGEPLQNYAWFSLILSLITIALIKTVSVAGWLHVLLVGRFYNQIKNSISADARFILLTIAGLSFLNGMLIIFKVNILPGRYVIIFGFVMIIFAAFALGLALKQWRLNSSKWDKTIVLISLIIISYAMMTNVMPKKAGYNMEQNAVAYLKEKGVMNEQIFFVTARARFYADAAYDRRGYDNWEFTKQAIDDGSISNYQYLMIPLKVDAIAKKQEAYIKEKLPQYQVEASFYGLRNKKKVVIYTKQSGT